MQALEAPVVDREFEKRPRKSRLHRNADPKLLEQWRPSRYRDDRSCSLTDIAQDRRFFETFSASPCSGRSMFDIAERRSLTSVLSPPKGYELEQRF